MALVPNASLGQDYLEDDSVCSRCHDALVFGFHRDIVPGELLESSKRGCGGCRLLETAISTYFSKTFTMPRPWPLMENIVLYPEGLISPQHEDKSQAPYPLRVECWFKDQFLLPSEVCLELYTHIGAPSIWPAIGVGKDISGNTSDDASFRLAREWIRECVNHHADCRSDKAFTLPKRLIDVGNDKASPYIIEDPQIPAEYVALSYRWGAAQPVKTVRKTLPQWKDKLPLGILPRTLRDAILVCRRLAIPYLWIDALCIIQDSVEDWQEQAAQMGSIYAHAYFRIAAEQGSDSNSGCFSQPGTCCQSVEIACNDLDGLGSSIWVRGHRRGIEGDSPGHVDAPEAFPATYDKRTSVLAKRGWILQEQILSRRTLYYNADELSWSCAVSQKCQCRSDSADGGV